MSHEITLVCLANARREGGRCVAGVDNEGDWVRPVSSKTQGELSINECRLDIGRDPRLLDRIVVPVTAPQVRPDQPENWVISGEPWRYKGHLDSTKAEELLDEVCYHDPDIFGDTSRYRVLSEMESDPIHHSLLVIEPEQLSWKVERWDNGAIHHRATFDHAGHTYDLPVTDPIIEALLSGKSEGTYARDVDGQLGARRFFLTMSLGAVWPTTGRCYKLVAGVLAIS